MRGVSRYASVEPGRASPRPADPAVVSRETAQLLPAGSPVKPAAARWQGTDSAAPHSTAGRERVRSGTHYRWFHVKRTQLPRLCTKSRAAALASCPNGPGIAGPERQNGRVECDHPVLFHVKRTRPSPIVRLPEETGRRSHRQCAGAAHGPEQHPGPTLPYGPTLPRSCLPAPACLPSRGQPCTGRPGTRRGGTRRGRTRPPSGESGHNRYCFT